MGKKTEGRLTIERLTKKEFFSIRNMDYGDVARLYKVSVSSASAAMKSLDIKHGTYRAYRTDSKLKDSPVINQSQMINDKKYNSFRGNNPLSSPVKTILQAAIIEYKEMYKNKYNHLINS